MKPFERGYNVNMETLEMIVVIVGGVLVVLLALWTIPLYRKLTLAHKAIKEKNDEIDAVEPDVNKRLTGTTANEDYRVRLVDKNEGTFTASARASRARTAVHSR
jgi:hypothetical protein